jgi:hypothetical protein
MRRTGSLGPATTALDALLAKTAALDGMAASPATAALNALVGTKAKEMGSASIEPIAGKKRRKKRTLKENSSSKDIGMRGLFDAISAENNEQAFPSIAWDFDDAEEDTMPPPAKKPNSSPSLGLLLRSPSLGKTASGGRLSSLARTNKLHAMSSLERAMNHHFERKILL